MQTLIGKIGEISVVKGITDKQIEELVHYSQTDPGIIKCTHDKDRFPDMSAYHNFPPTEKTVYILSNENDKLLGIIWFHYMEIPNRTFDKPINKEDFTITFGLRIYRKARGKGLAHKFMKIAFSHFLNSREYEKLGRKNIWGDAYSWNIPAIKVYKKFGFKEITEPDEDDRIILLYKPMEQNVLE